MKKITALVVALTVVLTGCSAGTSDKLKVDPNAHQYSYDDRTGICYSYTASMKGGLASMVEETTGLGKSSVACTDKVLQLAGMGHKGKATLNQWGHAVSFESDSPKKL